jgi:hypothetical protein
MGFTRGRQEILDELPTSQSACLPVSQPACFTKTIRTDGPVSMFNLLWN